MHTFHSNAHMQTEYSESSYDWFDFVFNFPSLLHPYKCGIVTYVVFGVCVSQLCSSMCTFCWVWFVRTINILCRGIAWRICWRNWGVLLWKCQLHSQIDLAVVGGRGKFKMAKGFVKLKTYLFDTTTYDAIVECDVTVIHHWDSILRVLFF